MKLETRYRVAGGVFFLALAIIFVPMLFDEPRSSKVEIAPMESVEIVDVASATVPEVPNALAKREALREVIDEDGFLRGTGTRIGDPSLLVDSEDATAWAVQLGSFKSDDLANTFRSQLRDEGQVTWVSRAKINDDIMTRVAVGPFQSRSEADEFREEATARYDVEAVVVRFTP